MEPSDKNFKISFTAIIIAIALSLGFIAAIGFSESEKISSASSNRLEQYKKEIYNSSLQHCQLELGYNYMKCLSQTRDLLRSEERAERDIVAQESMAVWTFVMSATAIIGLLSSIIGIALVWKTFQETRKSNYLTQAQITPYPSIDISFELGARNNDSYSPIITINVRNPGTTPIIDLSAVSRVSILIGGEIALSKSYTGNEERGLIRVEPNQAELVGMYPNDASFSPYIHEMTTGQALVKIEVQTTHADIFGKRTTTDHFYRSAKIYHHRNDGDADGVIHFNIKMQKYSPFSPDSH